MTMTQVKFQSIQAMTEAANADGPRHDTYSHKNEMDYGDLSFPQAIAMGNAGGYWPEGTKRMAEITARLNVGTPKMRNRYTNGMAGNRPNIPRYLAGAPKHMTRPVKTRPSPKKIIRIGASIARSWDSTHEQAMNQGAAILTVIEELETAGHSVELWALWRTQGGGDTFSCETLIKPANAFFTAADCAFAMCHAAFQRRLAWSIAELHPDARNVIRDSYGNGKNAEYNDFDAHLPYMVGSRGGYDTPQKALKTVKENLAGVLEVLK